VGHIKRGKNEQQQQQQGCNSGKSQPIKVEHAHPGELPPSLDRNGGDQEARYREEHLYAALAIPDEHRQQGWRQLSPVGDVAEDQAHVHVVQEHKEDGEAPQQVHAVKSLPLARG
jgi:hypothetical protein